MFGKGLKPAWYRVCRFLCRVFCVVCFRIRVHGKENVPASGPFMLVSNHQSYLDPLFCGVFLKRRLNFMARDTLFRNRFFRAILSSVYAIPVARGKADLSAMKIVISRLREGECVCLYPEGTRTDTGQIASLKGGFGLIARRGGSAIVPMVVDGAFECWPRHKKIFSVGARIVVCYGEAISAEHVQNMDEREIAEVVTERLCGMQNECRTRYGKKPYAY